MPTTLEKEAIEPGSGGLSRPGRRAWRPVLEAAAIWALAAFVAMNLVLLPWAGQEKSTSLDLTSGSGAIDLALTDLHVLKKRPDVVLLGSSLMNFPFWAVDRDQNPALPDIFHHHVSKAMEAELRHLGWKDPTVFSLAIFGQMVSDAYIYVTEYLKDAKRPEWIIMGIAPRDFSDFDLPAPTATMTFRRLVGLANFSRYADLYLPEWQMKADFLATHTCFLYGKRWRMQKELEKAVNKVYRLAGLTPPPATRPTGDQAAAFMLSGSDAERWQSSAREYRRRYRNIDAPSLNVQMGFLGELLRVCRERGTKVLIVNMPLTELNRSLLPAGFYDGFRARLARAAARPGVYLLDLGDSREFVLADYWDTAHLNHSGGRKLLKRVMAVLAAASAH
ncbi:MAG TPA: hypothetical protein V6D08_13005 [Candidatus Obscuribacterales bacterium]